MDVGTAKPSFSELGEVPHHLINILSPEQSFSAGLFKEKASGIIKDLHKRNKIPLIVGGTGLYIRALTRGLFDGPSADWTLREKLKEEENVSGKGHLYGYLKTIDPEAAERISPNDLRRTIRAIEVSLKGNKTISEFQSSSTKPEAYDFIKLGLLRDRKELYRLIEERVDKMAGNGLLQETERLLKMNPDRTALQALGYKEMRLYLNGQVGFDDAVQLLKKRTKRYAKRQITWFKKEPGINWSDVTGLAEPDKIFEKVLNDVEILRKLIYS